MMVAGPEAEQVVGLLEGAFSVDGYVPAERPTMQSGLPTVTTIGSGKKGLKTVNISTMAAITAASTGKVTVCKPVSSATSSLTGSADFASIVGIRADIELEHMHDVALATGLGIFPVASCTPKFVDSYDGIFFAPHAMSFGLAGLLAPYQTDSLIYGLAHPRTKLSHEVYSAFGVERPTVVSGSMDGVHYIDEALPLGVTRISDDEGTAEYAFGEILPAVSEQSFTQARHGSREDNVAKGLRALTPGSQSELRHTIALNSGLVLHAAGVVCSIEQGYQDSLEVIEDGRVLRHLKELVTATGGDPGRVGTLLSRVVPAQRQHAALDRAVVGLSPDPGTK